MDEQQRTGLALILNSIPFVTWDRMSYYTGPAGRESVVVYGWIKREDAHEDFVLVRVEDGELSYTTSSAKWSAKLGEILFGDAGVDEPCKRVEDELGELVSNVIRAES